MISDGPIVYWLGHLVLNQRKTDRNRLGSPSRICACNSIGQKFCLLSKKLGVRIPPGMPNTSSNGFTSEFTKLRSSVRLRMEVPKLCPYSEIDITIVFETIIAGATPARDANYKAFYALYKNIT